MKLIVLLLIAILMVGCASEKTINGKTYQPYGLVNQDLKDDNIRYDVPFGGVFLAIAFSETIAAPVYILGWDLYEPTSVKEKK